MAKSDYRTPKNKGVDLSSEDAKLNVSNTVSVSDDHLSDEPNPDVEGPQRHRGIRSIDVIANVVDKIDGVQVRFEGDTAILSKEVFRYITPDMIPNCRADLVEVAKFVQKKFEQIVGKKLKLELIDEDELPVGAGQGNKQLWYFTHTYRYNEM